MNFILTINCDNAAFADADAGYELARILRFLADRFYGDRLESGDKNCVLDYNGNKVGGYVFGHKSLQDQTLDELYNI